MSEFRFSPIQSKDKLLEAIEYLHVECHRIVKQTFSGNFPVAGDVGIFCHFEEEYTFLVKLQQELTVSSSNQNQKYFKLKEPVTFVSKNDLPSATYEWLYIRRPDPESNQVGDIDFVLEDKKYKVLKEQVLNNSFENARIYDRPNWDMIEINTKADALPFVCTREMAEKIKVRF